MKIICSLNMKLCISVILIYVLKCLGTCSQVPVKTWVSLFCSADTASEVWTDNDNEIMYADYIRQEIVFTVPKFFISDPRTATKDYVSYRRSTINRHVCQRDLLFLKEDVKYPADVEDPPDSVIYLQDELQQGEENTLICFVTHFFPPHIQINWTKNGVGVSEGVSISRYYHNEDATFHQLSSLTFTPKEGDVYGCTVEHKALDRPKTRFLKVEFNHPGVGPDIFCGVGLTLGLVGVAAGVFWGVRGRYATPVL
ncbi:H-2 class II histocompatibility antigen, A-U alpha chain-like isoform X2 [Festucalex cinctus]